MQQLRLATSLSLHFPHKHKRYVFIYPPLHLLVINQVLHPTQLTPMPLHPTLALLLVTWLLDPN